MKVILTTNIKKLGKIGELVNVMWLPSNDIYIIKNGEKEYLIPIIDEIIKKLDYDIITYDAGDVRNKSAIENITKHNIAANNIISLFKKEKKKIIKREGIKVALVIKLRTETMKNINSYSIRYFLIL